MSFLEILTLFASGVTIFAFIVGVFSVYNRRMTRREIGGLIRENQEPIRQTQELMRSMRAETLTVIREIHESTQQLIRETQGSTQQLIRETHESTQRLIRETQESTQEILRGITEILGRIEAHVR